jgi:hypothetical protein
MEPVQRLWQRPESIMLQDRPTQQNDCGLSSLRTLQIPSEETTFGYIHAAGARVLLLNQFKPNVCSRVNL